MRRNHSLAPAGVPMTPSPILSEEEPGFGRAAVLLCLVAVAGLLFWAAMTPLREVVTANGVVLPEGFSRSVEHLEGGAVGAVLIDEGDTVTAGQVLLRLDTSALEAERRRLEARREALTREIARQSAFAAGQAPTGDAGDGAIAQRQRDAAVVVEAFRNARLTVLRTEEALRVAELEALTARRGAVEEELRIVTERFLLYDETHRRSGAISGLQRDNAQLQVIGLQREAATLETDIDAAVLRVRMAQEKTAEYLAEVERDALLRAADLESRLAETAEELSRIEVTLARSEVVAPVTGTVQLLGAVAAGQVLAPGALVAEIVPADAALFVELRLPADRIGDVALGMEASIKALTFDFLRHGEATGVVEVISPSSAADPDGVLRYRVRLRLNAAQVGDGPTARPLRPGMTVAAEMRAGQRTVLEALLRPLRIIREKALTEL